MKDTATQIDETSISRLVNKHTDYGYAMVSACCLDWDEDPVKNRQMNSARTDEIKKDIYDSGFQFIPVQGGYHEFGSERESVEQSFIVVNYKRGMSEPCQNVNELKELAISLCGKYGQASVLVVEPGKKPTYYKKDGSIDLEFWSGTSVMENVKEYFTRRGRGREFAFLSEAEQPHTIMGCHCRASQGEIFLNPYSNSDI